MVSGMGTMRTKDLYLSRAAQLRAGDVGAGAVKTASY
jgi:hypothetical protein